MGDHTESIQIVFDPEQISYEELLHRFWNSHNPTIKSLFRDRQYMSLLIYHDEVQREKALASKQKQEEALGVLIKTEMTKDAEFYPAEHYHQKYFLRRYKKAVEALSRLYPTEEGFRDAAVTARLNGFVRGRSSMQELKQEIQTWGWSTETENQTIEVLDSIRW